MGDSPYLSDNPATRLLRVLSILAPKEDLERHRSRLLAVREAKRNHDVATRQREARLKQIAGMARPVPPKPRRGRGRNTSPNPEEEPDYSPWAAEISDLASKVQAAEGALRAAQTACQSEAPKSASMTVELAWRNAVGLQIRDVTWAELFRAAALTVQLPREVRDAVAELNLTNGVKSHLLEHLPQTENWLIEAMLAIQKKIELPDWQLVSSFRLDWTDRLKICADQLDHGRTTSAGSADRETISQIRSLIDEVVQLLDSKPSDVDSSLERFIRVHLKVLMRALEDAQILGVNAVKEAVEQTWGAAMLARETIDIAPRPNDPVKARAGFWTVVERLANIVVISSLLALPATVRDLSQLNSGDKRETVIVVHASPATPSVAPPTTGHGKDKNDESRDPCSSGSAHHDAVEPTGRANVRPRDSGER